jgi:proline racemase
VRVSTIDYHTAGEPFRIVTEGIPEIAGATVRERRATAAGSQEVDAVRRLLCHEPRGHADMYGCFLVAPDDDGADLGVLFWH